MPGLAPQGTSESHCSVTVPGSVIHHTTSKHAPQRCPTVAVTAQAQGWPRWVALLIMASLTPVAGGLLLWPPGAQ